MNNCAAAVLLAAAALAAGRELVVSRGQLVEIGGSFRVPDVVAQSGARLRRGGHHQPHAARATTSRALGPDTGAILRAHQSNFRTVGFVEEVEIEELCGAGGVPVIDDVGSGALAERRARAGRRAAGAALGGGRRGGGLLLRRQAARRAPGRPDGRAPGRRSSAAARTRWRARCGSTSSRWPRSRPRCKLYRDPAGALRELPVLRMLTAGEEELRARAERMRDALAAAGVDAQVITADAPRSAAARCRCSS